MIVWIAVAMCLSSIFADVSTEQIESSKVDPGEIAHVWKTLHSMQTQMVSLEDQLMEERRLRTQLQDQVLEERRLRTQLQDQVLVERSTSKELQKKVDQLQRNVAVHQELLEKKIELLVPTSKSANNDWGCEFETLTLSCPISATIQITSATYGMYNATCPDTCCTPDPALDCSELVSENSPEDWTHLTSLCDGQSSCGYEYKGRVIDDCEPGYVADYMHVFYDCVGLPEPTEEPEVEPVGFTAHATIDRGYTVDEIIRFDDVQSNFGGHYDGSSYTFRCPYNGIYQFSVSFNAYTIDYMYMEIVRENYVLGAAYAANSFNDDYDHASALVIVECSSGERVWARSRYSNGPLFVNDRSTQFTGYLLHRLDQ